MQNVKILEWVRPNGDRKMTQHIVSDETAQGIDALKMRGLEVSYENLGTGLYALYLSSVEDDDEFLVIQPSNFAAELRDMVARNIVEKGADTSANAQK